MTEPLRAFVALIRLTLLRHWRVPSLGWVSVGLVLLTAVAVGVFTFGPVGWRIENRPNWVADFTKPDPASVRMTYQQYALDRLPITQFLPGPPAHFGIKSAVYGGYQFLMVSPAAERHRDDRAFLSFSRWVVFGLYLGFVLPLFTLAYATGAIGGEREGRTLIWLTTRPLPWAGVYLGKFLGVLPWCLAVSLFGFAAVCSAGGPMGRQAFAVYWPSVVAGAIGQSALFFLIGAVFRRPAVVGLVYVFFFETLVANLPGSLKRLSLNYYVRSLMYHEASGVADVPQDQLDVYDPLGPTSAWVVLLVVSVVLTGLGMILFTRQEPREET